MPRYLPICLNVSGRTCAVFGAGPVAARKIAALIDADAHVRVVAPAVSEAVRALVADGRIQLVQRGYLPGDLEGAVLCVAATDQPALNQRIARDATTAGIPVNVADDPAASTFLLPAVMRDQDVTIAVSTGGRSPALAAFLRDEVRRKLPADLPALARALGTLRAVLKQRVPDRAERACIWREISVADIVDRLAQDGEAGLDRLIAEVLRQQRGA